MLIVWAMQPVPAQPMALLDRAAATEVKAVSIHLPHTVPSRNRSLSVRVPPR